VESGSWASSRFVWPPAIYGSATIISALLASQLPLIFLPQAGMLIARALGFIVTIGGLLLILTAVKLFRRAGTAIEPTAQLLQSQQKAPMITTTATLVSVQIRTGECPLSLPRADANPGQARREAEQRGSSMAPIIREIGVPEWLLWRTSPQRVDAPQKPINRPKPLA
jgi:hypothetical protein